MNEQEKHWANIKFNASKWRDLERNEDDIRNQILNLEMTLKTVQKERIKYMKKTRQLILIEII